MSSFLPFLLCQGGIKKSPFSPKIMNMSQHWKHANKKYRRWNIFLFFISIVKISFVANFMYNINSKWKRKTFISYWKLCPTPTYACWGPYRKAPMHRKSGTRKKIYGIGQSNWRSKREQKKRHLSCSQMTMKILLFLFQFRCVATGSVIVFVVVVMRNSVFL